MWNSCWNWKLYFLAISCPPFTVLHFGLHSPYFWVCEVPYFYPSQCFIYLASPWTNTQSMLRGSVRTPEIPFTLPLRVSVLSPILIHPNHGDEEGCMLSGVWWILCFTGVGLNRDNHGCVYEKSVDPHGPMKHGMCSPNETFVYLFMYPMLCIQCSQDTEIDTFSQTSGDEVIHA